MAVLHDEILVEEAEGLASRRGGQADQEGIEVEQYLAPEVVDRAMTFVHDDEIKKLRRDSSVIGHVRRFPIPWRIGIKGGAFLVTGVELGYRP